VWHRQLAVVHLVLLAALYWLAADAEAHRWLHHHHGLSTDEAGRNAKVDTHGHDVAGGAHGPIHHLEGHSHEESEANEDHGDEESAASDHCAVTLLQQGKWAFEPALSPNVVPISVRTWVVEVPSPADVLAVPSLRLPFSCGPPAA
jgi:hypothetical protein